jgi:DNA-binding transcriptional regulator GbsR (MarR family)
MPNARRPAAPTAESFPLSLSELFEAHGWPRLGGRVIGELMLAEPPFLSTAELCERIGTSKGHLSSAISMLEAMRMIERFGLPGTRQHHYRLTSDAFVRAMDSAAEPSRSLAAIADRALAEVPAGSRAAEELTRMRDFYRFLARRFPDLVAEFEAGAR